MILVVAVALVAIALADVVMNKPSGFLPAEKVTERINVPHCDAHQDGARMVQAGIVFRSYRYYQQFVQLNRATFGV